MGLNLCVEHRDNYNNESENLFGSKSRFNYNSEPIIIKFEKIQKKKKRRKRRKRRKVK